MFGLLVLPPASYLNAQCEYNLYSSLYPKPDTSTRAIFQGCPSRCWSTGGSPLPHSLHPASLVEVSVSSICLCPFQRLDFFCVCFLSFPVSRRWGSHFDGPQVRILRADHSSSDSYIFLDVFLAESPCRGPPQRAGLPRRPHSALPFPSVPMWRSSLNGELHPQVLLYATPSHFFFLGGRKLSLFLVCL